MRNLRRGDGPARRVAAASWPIRASQRRGSDPSRSPPCVRFCCIGHIACSVDACRSYHIPDADLNRPSSCSGGLTEQIRRTPASSSSVFDCALLAGKSLNQFRRGRCPIPHTGSTPPSKLPFVIPEPHRAGLEAGQDTDAVGPPMPARSSRLGQMVLSTQCRPSNQASICCAFRDPVSKVPMPSAIPLLWILAAALATNLRSDITRSRTSRAGAAHASVRCGTSGTSDCYAAASTNALTLARSSAYVLPAHKR